MTTADPPLARLPQKGVALAKIWLRGRQTNVTSDGGQPVILGHVARSEGDVAMADHDAFGFAGGAGCVENHRKVVRVRRLRVFGFERPCLGNNHLLETMTVCFYYDSAKRGTLLSHDLNIFLEPLGRNERLCAGIRDDVSDFPGRISGVHRHCHSTCLDGGEIPQEQVRMVRMQKRHTISRF